MNGLTTHGLYWLAGICAYAMVNHLVIALHRPVSRIHLLFAGMCLLMSLWGLSISWSYQAESIQDYASALKSGYAFIAPFFILFTGFVIEYTGARPRFVLTGSVILFTLLFVINLTQPYSIQLADIQRIQQQHLPWGETLSRPVGSINPWFYVGVTAVLAVFGYVLYALVSLYRRNRRRTVLFMLIAFAIPIITSIEGILVRLSVIDFVELGVPGFMALVIAMSLITGHEARQRLRASESRFRSLVEQSPFSIQVLAPDGHTLQINAAWEKLFGMKADALVGYNLLEDSQLVDKGIMPYIQQGFAGHATDIPPIVYNPADHPLLQGPTRDRWIRAFIYPIRDAHDAVHEVILMHEDVTEKKRTEDSIRLIATGVAAETGERFFQQLVQSLATLFDADYAYISVPDPHNAQRANTMTLYHLGKIVPGRSYNLAGTPCEQVLQQGMCVYPQDVQQAFPAARQLAAWDAQGYIGTALRDDLGKSFGVIAVLTQKPLQHTRQMQEILEIFTARAGAELQRLQAQAHIRQMAYQDYLTGLASRAHLHERLSDALRWARQTGMRGALLLIDLDHFKTINNALSHDVGDEVLRAVARCLSEAVAERAFLARLGGDEFVTLLHVDSPDSAEAERQARALAEDILHRLAKPTLVCEGSFNIGASIGIVMFPVGDESELDILRHADMALYQAKRLGRGNAQFYQADLQQVATTRLQMEAGLRQAITNDELTLHFQPQVDVCDHVIGAEVLLRWHHPVLGNVPPSAFIPVAEETGLIHTIGAWVFDRACWQLGNWLRDGVSFTGHLAVNVSPWQFSRPDFVDQVRQTLTRHRIDPGRMVLELTETALLYDLENTIEKLKTLRTIGLGVSLDDFGTGYSSLAYLKDLPLDQIKIDQAFVSELIDTEEHPLVESMIAIGRHMKLTVIAEGVETGKQHDILTKLGCERFQGYFFSTPLPEQGFLAWLGTHQASA